MKWTNELVEVAYHGDSTSGHVIHDCILTDCKLHIEAIMILISFIVLFSFIVPYLIAPLLV